MLRSEAWVWLARATGATIGVIIVASIAALVLGTSNVLVQVIIAMKRAIGVPARPSPKVAPPSG